jgi:hypothetical protein
MAKNESQPDPKQPDPKPEAPAAAGPGDEQVAGERDRAKARATELTAKLEQVAGERDLAKLEIAKLKNDLKLAGLEIAELRQRIEASSGSTLTGLPDGAFELLESVTVVGTDGRCNPKKGDVVCVDEPSELRTALAGKAKVYRVKRSTIEELGAMGALRRK